MGDTAGPGLRSVRFELSEQTLRRVESLTRERDLLMDTMRAEADVSHEDPRIQQAAAKTAAAAALAGADYLTALGAELVTERVAILDSEPTRILLLANGDIPDHSRMRQLFAKALTDSPELAAALARPGTRVEFLRVLLADSVAHVRVLSTESAADVLASGRLTGRAPETFRDSAIDDLISQRDALNHERHLQRVKRDERAERSGIDDPAHALSAGTIETTIRQLSDRIIGREYVGARLDLDDYTVAEEVSEETLLDRRKEIAKLQAAAWRVAKLDWDWAAYNRRIVELTGATADPAISPAMLEELDALAVARAEETVAVEPYRVMRDDIAARLAADDVGPLGRQRLTELLAEATHRVELADNVIGRALDEMALVRGAGRAEVLAQGGRMLTDRVGLVPGETPRLIVFATREASEGRRHELDTALESALLQSAAASRAFRTPATRVEFTRVLADDNGGWRLVDAPAPQRLIAEPQRTRIAQHMPASIVGWRDAGGNHRFVDESKPWTTGHSREPGWFGDGKERDPTKEAPKGITGWGMDPLQTSVLGNFETLPPGHVFTELTPAIPGALEHFTVPFDVYSSPIDGLLYNVARLVLETVGVFAGTRLRRDPLNPTRLEFTFKWHRQLSWFERRTNPDYRPRVDVQPRIHQWDAAEHATLLDPPSVPLQERERAQQQAWARVQEWADAEYRRFRAADHDIDRIVDNLAARDEDYRTRHADRVIDKVQSTVARLNPEFGRANESTLAKLTDWVAVQLHEDFRQQAPDIVGAIVDREPNIVGTIADRLAGSTFTHAEITRIKNYLMRDAHLAIDRSSGDPVRQRMDAVADVAEAWIRLAYGVPVDEDILLLRNSLAGSRYLAENPDALWREADRHAIALGFDWSNHRPPAAAWRIDIRYAPQPLDPPTSPLPPSRSRELGSSRTQADTSESGASTVEQRLRTPTLLSDLTAQARTAETEQRRAAEHLVQITATIGGFETTNASPRALGRAAIDHIDAQLNRPAPELDTVPTDPDDMVRSVWERLARDREHERLAGVRADIEQHLTRYLDARDTERELRRQLYDVAAAEAFREAGARALTDRIGLIDGNPPRALVLSTHSAVEPLMDDRGWRELTDSGAEPSFQRIVLDDAGQPHLVEWQAPTGDGRYRTANERLDVIEGEARQRIDEILRTAELSDGRFALAPEYANRIEEARQQVVAQFAAARQSAVEDIPDVGAVHAGAQFATELAEVVDRFTTAVHQQPQDSEVSRAPAATWTYSTPRPHATSPQVAATIADQTTRANHAVRRAKSAADALTEIHRALDGGVTTAGPRVTHDRINQHIEAAIAAARAAVGRDGMPQADQVARYHEIRTLHSLRKTAAEHFSTYLSTRAEAQRLADAATEQAIADVLAAAGVAQPDRGIGVLPGEPGRALVAFEGADPHLTALSPTEHRQRLIRGEQLVFHRVFVDEHGQVHIADAELRGGPLDGGLDTPVRGANSGGSPSVSSAATVAAPVNPPVITGPHYDIIRGTDTDEAASELRIRLHLDTPQSGDRSHLDQSIVDAAYTIVFGSGKWYSPLTGAPYQFTLDPVGDASSAHLRLDRPATTTDIGAAARVVAVALREHLGLPPTSSTPNGLTVDEGDIEVLTREARLGGLRLAVPDAHYAFRTTRAREALAPLESESLQVALEQAARSPEGGFTRGFDPRTSTLGDLINPGGDSAPGRGGNCWAVVASALLTFFGDPQVAPPVRGYAAVGTATTMAEWLHAGMVSWRDRTIDLSSFETVQQQVAALGPGSAAPVFVGWQDTDSDGNPECRADGSPVLLGHALLVVYPLDASHPVWWCPQEQIAWDRPPSKYVEDALVLNAIPLLPDGTPALAYTDPNTGGSPAVHHPSAPAHRPRVGPPVRVRLDSDGAAADPGGPTGHTGRNSPIHPEFQDGGDHQSAERTKPSLDRPIHRGDENRGTTTGTSTVPTAHPDTPRTDRQRNPAGPLPDPSAIPVRGQRTGPGIPADDRQAGLGVQPDVLPRHPDGAVDPAASHRDGRLAGDGRARGLEQVELFDPTVGGQRAALALAYARAVTGNTAIRIPELVGSQGMTFDEFTAAAGASQGPQGGPGRIVGTLADLIAGLKQVGDRSCAVFYQLDDSLTPLGLWRDPAVQQALQAHYRDALNAHAGVAVHRDGQISFYDPATHTISPEAPLLPMAQPRYGAVFFDSSGTAPADPGNTRAVDEGTEPGKHQVLGHPPTPHDGPAAGGRRVALALSYLRDSTASRFIEPGGRGRYSMSDLLSLTGHRYWTTFSDPGWIAGHLELHGPGSTAFIVEQSNPDDPEHDLNNRCAVLTNRGGGLITVYDPALNTSQEYRPGDRTIRPTQVLFHDIDGHPIEPDTVVGESKLTDQHLATSPRPDEARKPFPIGRHTVRRESVKDSLIALLERRGELETALRDNTFTPAIRDKINGIDASIERLPKHTGPVHRLAGLAWAEVSRYQIGGFVQEPGYVLATTKNFAPNRSDINVHFTITAKSARAFGDPAHLYRRWNGRPFDRHEDIVFERGTSFSVINRVLDPRTGILHIDLVELAVTDSTKPSRRQLASDYTEPDADHRAVLAINHIRAMTGSSFIQPQPVDRNHISPDEVDAAFGRRPTTFRDPAWIEAYLRSHGHGSMAMVCVQDGGLSRRKTARSRAYNDQLIDDAVNGATYVLSNDHGEISLYDPATRSNEKFSDSPHYRKISRDHATGFLTYFVDPTGLPVAPTEPGRTVVDDNDEFQKLSERSAGIYRGRVSPQPISLTSADRAALRNYNDNLDAINENLRTGSGLRWTASEQFHRTLAKFPDYRAVAYRIETLPIGTLLTDYTPGSVVRDSGHAVASKKRPHAVAGDVEFTILSSTGKDVGHYFSRHQNSIVFGLGTEFRVISRHLDPDTGVMAVALMETSDLHRALDVADAALTTSSAPAPPSVVAVTDSPSSVPQLPVDIHRVAAHGITLDEIAATVGHPSTPFSNSNWVARYLDNHGPGSTAIVTVENQNTTVGRRRLATTGYESRQGARRSESYLLTNHGGRISVYDPTTRTSTDLSDESSHRFDGHSRLHTFFFDPSGAPMVPTESGPIEIADTSTFRRHSENVQNWYRRNISPRSLAMSMQEKRGLRRFVAGTHTRNDLVDFTNALTTLPDYRGLVYRVDSLPLETIINDYRPGSFVSDWDIRVASKSPAAADAGQVAFRIMSSSGKDISAYARKHGEPVVILKAASRYQVISRHLNAETGVMEITLLDAALVTTATDPTDTTAPLTGPPERNEQVADPDDVPQVAGTPYAAEPATAVRSDTTTHVEQNDFATPPLTDIAATREFGPGRIAPLEIQAYQDEVERAAAGRAGFDPRTDPVPINDGGMSVPGRFTNCVECVMAGLSSFFGRPTVAFPRESQLLSTGTMGYASGESPRRVAQWLGADLLQFDPALDVTEHYRQLHDLIAELGPGSAAFVATRWQRVDEAGQRVFRPDGSRVLKGGHASAVVFPLDADGPVWWDPQSSTTDDSPSAKFLSDAGQLRVIVLRPDGSVYRAGTDPNQGRSRDLPDKGAWPRPEMATRPHGVRLDRLSGTDGPGARGRGVPEPADAGARRPDSANPPISELVGASSGRQLPGIDQIGHTVRGTDLPAPRPAAVDAAATRSGRAGIPGPGRVPGVTEHAGDGVLDADRPAHRSSPADTRGVGTRGGVDTHAEPQREQVADRRDSRVLNPLAAEIHAQFGFDTEAGVAHHADDPAMADLAGRVRRDDRYFTADVHLDDTGAAVIGGRRFSPEEYGDLLSHHTRWGGRTPIRLIGCDAASGSFAARLAAHLGTDVLAPTARAWTDEHGRVYTSGFEIDATGNRRPRIPPDGQWITHHPDGTTALTTTDGFAPGTPTTDRSSHDPNTARERGWRDRFRSRPRPEQSAVTEPAATDPYLPTAIDPADGSPARPTPEASAAPTTTTEQPPVDVPFTLSAPAVAEPAKPYIAPDLSSMPPLRDFIEGSSDDQLSS